MSKFYTLSTHIAHTCRLPLIVLACFISIRACGPRSRAEGSVSMRPRRRAMSSSGFIRSTAVPSRPPFAHERITPNGGPVRAATRAGSPQHLGKEHRLSDLTRFSLFSKKNQKKRRRAGPRPGTTLFRDVPGPARRTRIHTASPGRGSRITAFSSYRHHTDVQHLF